MSKSLILVRHAKSSWEDPSLTDFDRPLNDRGKKEAPEMANRLNKKKIQIDKLVSSPAKRAKQTSTQFAKAFDFKKKSVLLDPRLYEASEKDFYEVIESLKDKWDTVAIFSHNPGITAFANSLTDVRIDDMPTSAVFACKVTAESWKDFKKAKKEFWFFTYPKAGESS